MDRSTHRETPEDPQASITCLWKKPVVMPGNRIPKPHGDASVPSPHATRSGLVGQGERRPSRQVLPVPRGRGHGQAVDGELDCSKLRHRILKDDLKCLGINLLIQIAVFGILLFFVLN